MVSFNENLAEDRAKLGEDVPKAFKTSNNNIVFICTVSTEIVLYVNCTCYNTSYFT